MLSLVVPDVSKVTTTTLRKLFGALSLKEKYEALDTLLELLDLDREYTINLPPEEDQPLNPDRLSSFENELEKTSPEMLAKFQESLIRRELFKPIKQGPLALYEEPVDIDSRLLILEMSQADRFRLAGLILETEIPGVGFSCKQIEQRIFNEWNPESDDPNLPLPDHLKFANLSKTSTDLVKANDIEYVEKLNRSSTFRLTRKGILSAQEQVKTLSIQDEKTKPAESC